MEARECDPSSPGLVSLGTPLRPKALNFSDPKVRIVVPASPGSTVAPDSPPQPQDWSPRISPKWAGVPNATAPRLAGVDSSRDVTGELLESPAFRRISQLATAAAEYQQELQRSCSGDLAAKARLLGWASELQLLARRMGDEAETWRERCLTVQQHCSATADDFEERADREMECAQARESALKAREQAQAVQRLEAQGELRRCRAEASGHVLELRQLQGELLDTFQRERSLEVRCEELQRALLLESQRSDEQAVELRAEQEWRRDAEQERDLTRELLSAQRREAEPERRRLQAEHAASLSAAQSRADAMGRRVESLLLERDSHQEFLERTTRDLAAAADVERLREELRGLEAANRRLREAANRCLREESRRDRSLSPRLPAVTPPPRYAPRMQPLGSTLCTRPTTREKPPRRPHSARFGTGLSESFREHGAPLSKVFPGLTPDRTAATGRYDARGHLLSFDAMGRTA